MSKELATKRSVDKFRERIQQSLMEHEDEFWEDFSQLDAKDKCEIYIKMMSFGISRATEQKGPSDKDKKRIVLEETTRKATLIAGGVNSLPEDVQYEEEE